MKNFKRLTKEEMLNIKGNELGHNTGNPIGCGTEPDPNTNPYEYSIWVKCSEEETREFHLLCSEATLPKTGE